MDRKKGIGTLAVQAGWDPVSGEPRILPIYQSTTYKYEKTDDVAKLFDLEAPGHMYTRISNPTVAGYEDKICQLEGGVGALATSSGQAATYISIFNIASVGQRIIAASTLYGGTFTLMASTFKKFGVEVDFIDPEATEEDFIASIKPETRAIFAETIGNPGLNVLDFEKFSRVAKKAGIPLIIDNTFGTPYLCRPFELGADIVMHSSTKYIDGHATSVGGIIVDGGRFDWAASGKYPEITEPDPTYHGVKYVEQFGKAAYITKARVTLMRDIGACMSPFNAFLTNLGCETLHLRMRKHSDNALALAEHLAKHPDVAWVNYPGLSDSPYKARVDKYLPLGASGVLAFGVKGGVEAGAAFIDSLKLAALVVHVGDIRTSVLHPATSTHRQLTPEQQIAGGVSPDLIRVSVGIEDIEDIIEDFDQALKLAAGR